MNTNTDFHRQLNEQLAVYFRAQRNGRYANGTMWLKIALLLVLWVGTWGAALFIPMPDYVVVLLAFVHVLSHLSIILNIAHDAGHGAISRHSWLNKLLTYTFDLVGVSSYLWIRSHNLTHHHHTNVLGADDAIQGYGVIRYSPHAEWKPFFRLQHLYAPLVYAAISANYVFRKDFVNFYRLLRYETNPPWGEFSIMLAMRMFYIAYMVVIPVIVLPYPFWQIALVLMAAHALLGQMIAVIQAGHMHDGAVFPPDTRIAISDASHVMQTTIDYAVDSRLMDTLMGNINLHVIHHLRPGICHTHYRTLTRMVKEVAAATGLPYRYVDSFWHAYRLHYRLLRQLAQPDATVIVSPVHTAAA